MKFIDLPELNELSSKLDLSSQTLKVHTRFEAYSCKAVSSDRKLYKKISEEITSEIEFGVSVSPPEYHGSLLESVFGPLNEKESLKTFYMLISLLNMAYPDHDFSKLRPDVFKTDTMANVLHALSSSYDSQLITTLNGAIELADCVVYSYTPDPESDPNVEESDSSELSDEDHDELMMDLDDDGPSPYRSFALPASQQQSAGLAYSVNYFLYNKKMKRILFVSIWAKRHALSSPSVDPTAMGNNYPPIGI